MRAATPPGACSAEHRQTEKELDCGPALFLHTGIFPAKGLFGLDVGLAVGGGDTGLADEEDQHDDRDHIGDHGNQMHIDAGGAAEHDLEAGAEAEQQAAAV